MDFLVIFMFVILPALLIFLTMKKKANIKNALEKIGFVPTHTSKSEPLIAVNPIEKKVAFIYASGKFRTFDASDLRSFDLNWTDVQKGGLAKWTVAQDVRMKVTVNDFNTPVIDCFFDKDLPLARDWQAKLSLMTNG